MKQTAYKGFNLNSNNELVCRDMVFRVGEVASVDGALVLCRNGIHFCWNLNDIDEYYNLRNSVICEVEILGDIVNQEDMKKSCTNRLKVLRILSKEEVWKISNTGHENTGYINTGNRNTGDCNTGDCNTGNRNTGNCNTGNRNTGNWNTGNWNTGDCNTGNCNTGNRNTGDCNTGDCNTGNRNTGNCNTGNRNTGNWNTGNWNTGDCNTGNCNTGNRNTGDCNTGNCNTGNRNTGDWNTGDCNTGDWNSGFFNAKENKCFIFDKLSDMTVREFQKSKYYSAIYSSAFILTEWIEYTAEEKSTDKAKELIGGYLKQYDYKEACAKWWAEMSAENREIIQQIPNFDADKFFEITGIRV